MTPSRSPVERWVLGVIMLLVLGGCAAQRPVLYPNAHYNRVGPAQARADVDHCLTLAKRHGAGSGMGKKVAKRTARGAAVGGTTGAAVGVVAGNAGTAAAAGAAGGAASGLSRALFDSNQPSAVTREFVDRCLYDQGYETVGWE